MRELLRWRVAALGSIIVLGCQATRAGQRGEGDSLSLLDGASDCGMVVTVGRPLGAYGADETTRLTLPAEINLSVQHIVCGQKSPGQSNHWLAIGMAVERSQVFSVMRDGTVKSARVRMAADGGVSLVVPTGGPNTLDDVGGVVDLGRAVEADYAMPVALLPGTRVEMRYQGRPVGPTEAKALGVSNLEVWIIAASS